MTANAVVILFYLPIAAALGFIVGWTCGDHVCRCQHAEEKVEELTEQLDLVRSAPPVCDRQFKELRGVLNDAHKHIVAVSKALQKQAR